MRRGGGGGSKFDETDPALLVRFSGSGIVCPVDFIKKPSLVVFLVDNVLDLIPDVFGILGAAGLLSREQSSRLALPSSWDGVATGCFVH